jgi:hypothetical protein
MIRAITGEFKLDDYNLIIHPELTASQFLAGDVPISKKESSNKTGWTVCWFTGVINGMKADFRINFRWEKLCLLGWEPKVGEKRDAWTSKSIEDQKHLLDDWLLKVVGSPTPYEYEWGTFGSVADMHSGDYSIIVEFKHGLWDRGITDFKSFFNKRRKYFAKSR